MCTSSNHIIFLLRHNDRVPMNILNSIMLIKIYFRFRNSIGPIIFPSKCSWIYNCPLRCLNGLFPEPQWKTFRPHPLQSGKEREINLEISPRDRGTGERSLVALGAGDTAASCVSHAAHDSAPRGRETSANCVRGARIVIRL